MSVFDNLNYYKNDTYELCIAKKWNNVDIHSLWMFLMEEIGELASATRRKNNQFNDGKKISVENEIMDVLSYLFQISYILDIDLSDKCA
mgnify:CR=1 FL=1